MTKVNKLSRRQATKTGARPAHRQNPDNEMQAVLDEMRKLRAATAVYRQLVQRILANAA